MRLALGLLMLTLATARPAVAAGPQASVARKDTAEERERNAQTLYDAAVRLEKSGKVAEAQAKYKELQARYRGTHVYRSRGKEIYEKIIDLGAQIAIGALSRQKLYNNPHIDAFLGFEFKPPEGWHGVPPAKRWFGMTMLNEKLYRGQVIRATRYTSNVLEKLYLYVLKPFAPRSAAEMERAVVGRFSKTYPGFKEVGKSVLEGRGVMIPRKVFTTGSGDRVAIYLIYGQNRGSVLVGAWRAGLNFNDVTIVRKKKKKTIVVRPATKPVSAEDFSLALDVLDKVAKSFWVYDPRTQQARSRQYKGDARCSDWSFLTSPKGNYLIEYQTGKKFAKEVGETMERIFALYNHVLPNPKKIPQCRIKVFDRKEDFLYYGAPSGAAAYWSSGQEEIVCYRFSDNRVLLDTKEEHTLGRKESPEDVTFKVLHHEGFHQYVHYLMGKRRQVYVPSWLNEGLGDYYHGGRFEQRRFKVSVNDWRVGIIHKAVKEGKHVPLRKILYYSKADYYRNPSICYAQGWAMCYFFLSEEGEKKKYFAFPQLMIQQLKKHGDWKKATKQVFANFDLDTIELEFKAFVLALPVPGKGKEPVVAPAPKRKPEPAAPVAGANSAGLLGHWSMDEGKGRTVADALGGKAGDLRNGTGWTSGKSGGALEFDGQDDHVIVSDSDNDLDFGENLTVAVWIKTTATSKGGKGRRPPWFKGHWIVDKDLKGESRGWALTNLRGKARFYVNVNEQTLASKTRISDGQWRHLAGVRDHRGNKWLYVDGILEASSTGGSTASMAHSGDLVLGGNAGMKNFFKGSMDDVRIYARALSATEVAALAGGR